MNKELIIKVLENALRSDTMKIDHKMLITEAVLKSIIEVLKEQSEVIRCKDCAHLDEEIGWNGEKYMTCFLSPLPPVRKADDFCSLAERRAKDEEQHT